MPAISYSVSLLESVFKSLPELDKLAAPSVAGDAAVLKKKMMADARYAVELSLLINSK